MGSPAGLAAVAAELGFDSVGVCSASASTHVEAYEAWLAKGYQGEMGYLARHAAAKRDVDSLLPGVRSIVAATLGYGQAREHVPGQARIAQYALGRDYHKVLRGKLRRLAGWISAQNPGSTARVCVDSAPVLEREYAHLAGLGWFGKNTMLIDSKRGSRFFIGLVLTTALLEADRPSVGGCGTCRACVEACPTGAIVQEEGRWQVDARRCVSYLTIEHRGEIAEELTRGMGEWTFGCDVCQDVCPFNQARISQPLRARGTREGDFLAREWPDLASLAEIGYAQWDDLTRGSAVRRAGWEGLRRNARINLANARR